MKHATSPDQLDITKPQFKVGLVVMVSALMIAAVLAGRHFLGHEPQSEIAPPQSPALVLGQHQAPPDDDMRQRELEAFVAIGEGSTTHANTAVHQPRFDKALLKETDAFLAAIDSVLQRFNDPNWTAVAREHSLWGIDLYKRSEVFTGTGSPADRMSSPYRVCHEAVYFAKERWLTRLAYANSPTQDNYAAVQRFEQVYAQKRADCARAGAST